MSRRKIVRVKLEGEQRFAWFGASITSPAHLCRVVDRANASSVIIPMCGARPKNVVPAMSKNRQRRCMDCTRIDRLQKYERGRALREKILRQVARVVRFVTAPLRWIKSLTVVRLNDDGSVQSVRPLMGGTK